MTADLAIGLCLGASACALCVAVWCTIDDVRSDDAAEVTAPVAPQPPPDPFIAGLHAAFSGACHDARCAGNGRHGCHDLDCRAHRGRG